MLFIHKVTLYLLKFVNKLYNNDKSIKMSALVLYAPVHGYMQTTVSEDIFSLPLPSLRRKNRLCCHVTHTKSTNQSSKRAVQKASWTRINTNSQDQSRSVEKKFKILWILRVEGGRSLVYSTESIPCYHTKQILKL
jgi:hypothetical protein